MEINSEILQEVETSLIGQQRLLVSLKQRQQEHPDATETLDPLVAKLEAWTGYLAGVRDELRLAAVVQRT